MSVCSCSVLSWFCRSNDGATDVPALVAATRRAEQAGAIDPTSLLARQRVFLFSGALDEKVPPSVVRALARYYSQFTTSANVRLVDQVRANHTMPTMDFGTPCTESEPPYLGRCHFDAAGELLGWIYGALQPARPTPGGGLLLEFDQSSFLADPTRHGLDTSGLVFVPARCGAGERCRLHVAFHGCRQGQSFKPLWTPFASRFGRTFAERAGYNAWAEANDIVVLYPQAVPTLSNPQGCWDWWGFDVDRHAVKAGRQIAAVRAMVERIASGRR